jgi:hypothetical protein
MISAILFFLVIAVGIFFALTRKSLKARLIWSLLFFSFSVGGLIAFILIVGDRPPRGSIPITEEVIKKEGMTEKEWKSYIEKQK